MATTGQPLRRDAERNRRRILAAAQELFAERGLDATLDDVAARARLGVGTVYRRFGSRDRLIDALFEERVAGMVALAEDALGAEDPWIGLTEFLERALALQAADRGLKELVLGTTEGRARIGQVRDQMRPCAEQLVRRAQEAGALRADLAPQDLPLLQMMVGAVVDVSVPEHPDLWRRFLALLLDGMRAERASGPLPAPPLRFDELPDVMRRFRPARRPPEASA